MRIDVAAPDAWGRLSEGYRAQLPSTLQDPSLNVHIFNGVQHGILETTKALAHLYSHKKTIAIISNVDPALVSIAVAFSQDEFQVRMIMPEEAKQAATWASMIDELLFVLAPEDDPITGELTDLSGLDEATKGKRVFKILISHEAHNWKRLVPPEPFVARILSLTSDRALLIGGSRCKIQPQTAPTLYWHIDSSEEIRTRVQHLIEPRSDAEIKKTVLDFERRLPSGFHPYFTDGEDRLFDRTVFYSKDYDGLSVIEELSSTLLLPLARAGEKSELETTSACRWESPRLQDWLIARGESDATTRGLVIASSHLIEQGLATHLEKAAHKIERLQNGT